MIWCGAVRHSTTQCSTGISLHGLICSCSGFCHDLARAAMCTHSTAQRAGGNPKSKPTILLGPGSCTWLRCSTVQCDAVRCGAAQYTARSVKAFAYLFLFGSRVMYLARTAMRSTWRDSLGMYTRKGSTLGWLAISLATMEMLRCTPGLVESTAATTMLAGTTCGCYTLATKAWYSGEESCL